MPAVKLLHTSDIHIDWPFEGFAEEARVKRRADLFNAFSFICSLALSEGVRGLLISGDLFHSDRMDRHSAAFVIAEFLKLREAGIKVVILPGNHDPGVEALLKRNGGLPPNVFVFSGDGWQEYRGIEGVTIYGCPFDGSKGGQNVLAGFHAADRERFTVGLLHASLHGLPHIEGEYFPITIEDIRECGLDYLALGHFHNFRDCSGGETLCFYPGAPDRLTFNNLSDRKALIVTLEAGKTTAEAVTVPARPYIVVDFDLNRESLAELYLRLNQWEDGDACVRVNISGVVDDGSVFSAARLEQQFRDKFFNIEINDYTRVIPGVDPADKTVKGIFLNRLRSKLEDESLSDDERQVLTEALRVGLTVLEGGKL